MYVTPCKTTVTKPCGQCGTLITIPACHDHCLKNCSRECQDRSRRKKDGFEYKGRWFSMNSGGYYMHCKSKTLFHRQLWEEAYGPIPSGHDVHHKNEVKTDNWLANYELLSHTEHARRHTIERHAKRRAALAASIVPPEGTR